MRFAHMADLHLGATSEPRLRELELDTLRRALDTCLDECVDFIIISGDIFHVNVPDLGVVRDAVSVFRRFTDTGRKIYVVYGSHDFSPNYTSVIDILEAAGLFVRVGKPTVVEGRVRPSVAVDRSGALLTGVSGRRASLEREALASIDREYLGSLEGFKIFVFHTGIDEVREKGERFEGVASTDLPQGFDYYAGGHIHRTAVVGEGVKVAFPGPLFTGWGSDLEATVRGVRRGFFIVDASRGVRLRFVDMTSFEGIYKEVDATGLAAADLNQRLGRLFASDDVGGKVIVLKVFGELAAGKTSDIDFARVREEAYLRGAIYLHLNRYRLSTREMAVSAKGGMPAEIEDAILRGMAGSVRSKNPRLKGEPVKVAKDMLSGLKVPKREGETEAVYNNRVLRAAGGVLGIPELEAAPDLGRRGRGARG